MRNFLFKNGIELLESEYQAIFKRLDIDKDGKITFREFKSIFALNSTSTSIYLNNSSNLTQTLSSTRRDILAASNNNFNQSIRESPNVNKTAYLSPLRRSNELNLSLSRSNNRDLNRSYNNELFKTNLRDSLSNKFNTYEEELFLEYLKDTLQNEREIERLKCDLTLKSDFNLSDLYKIFELNRLGYLSAGDVKYGMNLFNVFPSMEEINLIIKRYDGSSTLR